LGSSYRRWAGVVQYDIDISMCAHGERNTLIFIVGGRAGAVLVWTNGEENEIMIYVRMKLVVRKLQTTTTVIEFEFKLNPNFAGKTYIPRL
jgi:hypothetical protein